MTGVGLRQPVPSVDVTSFLAFNVGDRSSAIAASLGFPAMNAAPAALTFVRHDAAEPDEMSLVGLRDTLGAHGRFAAPGNAVRRQVQLRPISPRTADELAGFFRDVAYSLTDIRLGEAVPPIRVERVPDDLGTKDGIERKALFITAILPVILEVNQRVLAEREQLLYLRDKLAAAPDRVTSIERQWLENLADRYDTPVDKIDELVRRVDLVPPSMAIAQGGIESGWGTSFAARTGNALFGQIQSVGRHSVSVPWKPGAGMPQPFTNVAEAAEAYVVNLNTHPAYAAFRIERAAMRERREPLDGFKLIGQLLRYSELGQEYVRFVRQVMREDKLTDFDSARLSSF
ncbi:MAG: glucosaminidase domain-containing protein [Reyranellales bacterium]